MEEQDMSSSGGSKSESDSNKTVKTNNNDGTYLYMSPEQVH